MGLSAILGTICLPSGYTPSEEAKELEEKINEAQKWCDTSKPKLYKKVTPGNYIGFGAFLAGLVASTIGYFKEKSTVSWIGGIVSSFGLIILPLTSFNFIRKKEKSKTDTPISIKDLEPFRRNSSHVLDTEYNTVFSDVTPEEKETAIYEICQAYYRNEQHRGYVVDALLSMIKNPILEIEVRETATEQLCGPISSSGETTRQHLAILERSHPIRSRDINQEFLLQKAKESVIATFQEIITQECRKKNLNPKHLSFIGTLVKELARTMMVSNNPQDLKIDEYFMNLIEDPNTLPRIKLQILPRFPAIYKRIYKDKQSDLSILDRLKKIIENEKNFSLREEAIKAFKSIAKEMVLENDLPIEHDELNKILENIFAVLIKDYQNLSKLNLSTDSSNQLRKTLLDSFTTLSRIFGKLKNNQFEEKTRDILFNTIKNTNFPYFTRVEAFEIIKDDYQKAKKHCSLEDDSENADPKEFNFERTYPDDPTLITLVDLIAKICLDPEETSYRITDKGQPEYFKTNLINELEGLFHLSGKSKNIKSIINDLFNNIKQELRSNKTISISFDGTSHRVEWVPSIDTIITALTPVIDEINERDVDNGPKSA